MSFDVWLFNSKNLKFNFFINKKINFNKCLVIDLMGSQLKTVILNFILNKKFNYSTGLILKILNIYKKADKKTKTSFKYLLSYLIQKEYILDSKLVILKGLTQNYLKFLYFLKNIIVNKNLNFFILKICRKNLFKIRVKRSIKRRIYKKLIKFN